MNVNANLNKLGIDELSPMQQEASKLILREPSDVVILSPTGSGKTLAYLLPLIQKINPSSDTLQAVVIVPNRELALQSSSILKALSTPVRSYACYGGRPAMDEHKQLKRIQPQIIFATPGRLNDHICKGNIATNTICYVVIDEFDKCLEMGFQNEMKEVLAQLHAVKQRILLSATDADSIPEFVNVKHLRRLDYLDEGNATKQIQIFAVSSPDKDKLETLSKLLLTFGNQSSIVFVNHRDSAERIHEYLQNNRFSSTVFHGGLDQKQRETSLYQFSNGSVNVLVSTDLASRGLDIPDVSNIVHYHLPEHEDGFIHRIGRTARWDKEGKSFLIIGPTESIPEFISSDITFLDFPEQLPSRPMESKMATLYIGKGKKNKISKMDVVGFLCKTCGLAPAEIGRIDVKDYYVYVAVVRNKLQQVIQMAKGKKIKGVRTVVEPIV